MEVHHHSHSHGKKNWRAYSWEFIMLFLAVFCGFLAEYQLEHVIEHQREKEYILSMIEDAKTDAANLKNGIALNAKKFKRLDTLAFLCLNYDLSGNKDAEIYRLFRYVIVHPDFVTPTERTIHQLKNAGGMRLLRNKVAVDSIVIYDDMCKKVANQQGYYELTQSRSIELGAQILSFELMRSLNSKIMIGKTLTGDSLKKLINPDKLKVIEFGNWVELHRGVVQFYIVRLQEMHARAKNLVQTLQKEYHLEAE